MGDEEIKEDDAMEYLTAQGRKTIEKLRGFVSRQDVFDYLVRQELSSACENKLKNIIMTQPPQQHAVEGKKKRVKV